MDKNTQDLLAVVAGLLFWAFVYWVNNRPKRP